MRYVLYNINILVLLIDNELKENFTLLRNDDNLGYKDQNEIAAMF